MSHRFLLASASATLVVALAAPTVPVAADTATQNAVDWIESVQEPDGGFELANFPPFETPDAILAIAENAQATGVWSTTEAQNAVQVLDQVPGAGNGGTPLEWADAFLSGPTPSAGIAAKFIVLVAGPLGESTTAFNPDDTGSPVNLESIMDAGELPDHSYGAGVLNATLYALLAQAILGRPAPDDTIDYVRSVQQANGGWNYAGDPNGTDRDNDTTALAVQALIANGVPPGDVTVARALALLASLNRMNGSWRTPGTFGAPVPDPNATAVATLGVAAAGWDPTTRCWRDALAPTRTGEAFTSPEQWFETQQVTVAGPAPDETPGRIRSPNDGFGVSTFATTQTLQAVFRSWLPFNPAELQPAPTYTDIGPCLWFTQPVSWVDDNDVALGFADGTYRPADSVTRGQAVFFLWNAMDQPPGSPHGFLDVSTGAFYDDALDWATFEEIVTGFSDQTYRPRDPVNRGQIVNMLWKMVGSPPGSPPHGFTDVGMNVVYGPALDWAKANGIVNGFGGNTFRPKDPVTRAQLAGMLFRLASTEPAWGEVPIPTTVEFMA